jgi:hypothetical protein
MASVSWPSVTVAPDDTTIGFNPSGLLTVLQSPKLVLPSGISVAQDPSGYLGVFSGSGTEVETVDAAGHHVFVNTSGSTNNYNFEIITNGTTTTLTSPANSINNYPRASDSGVLYIQGHALVIDGVNATITMLSSQANGNRLVAPGNIGLGSFGPDGPFQIINVGAITAGSAFSAVNLSASYSTTSTTALSTGLGTAKITVSSYTVNLPLVVNFYGYGYNNTLGDGVTLSLYVSTAGVPAQGSAPPSTDTLLTSITVTQEGLVSNPNSMPIPYVYTPTATGSYYFYVAVNSVTGGTATIATPSTIVARGW